jgi:phosphonate transport system substrate-binding protein
MRVLLRCLIPLCIFFFLFSIPSLRGETGKRYLLIGLIPERNIFRQIDRYRPLADYLSVRLGIKVRLTILSRYGDIIDRFSQRGMDGAFFGDLTGALAVELLKVEPVARSVGLDGGSSARGVIIVRKDSGIRKAEDLKGKVFAFVDRATVSGYLFPLYYLRKAGFRNLNEVFSEYYFTGSHDSAVLAVLDGRADAGSLKDTVLKDLIRKDSTIGDELMVLAESPPMPEGTFCLRADLPPEVRKKIRELLLGMKMDNEGMKVLQKMGLSGFSPANRDDFAPVIGIMEEIGIGLRDYDYRTTLKER